MRQIPTVLLIVLTVLVSAADGRAALAATSSAAPDPSLTSMRAVPRGVAPITPETLDRVGRLARWGNGQVRNMAYSGDGTLLAVGTEVGIALFDASTLSQRGLLEAGGAVLDLAVSTDGSVIAAVVSGMGVRLWRVADGAPLGQLKGDLVVAISPDGQYVAAATGRGHIQLWRIADLAPVRDLDLGVPSDSTFTSSLAFSPDGRLLAAGAGSPRTFVVVWSIEDDARLHQLTGHTSYVRQLRFAPDGQSLASSSDDGSVHVWSMADGSILRTIPLNGGRGRISPDLSSIVVSRKGSITLQRTADGSTVAALSTDPQDFLDAAAFSPDGAVLGTWAAPDDEVVRLWRVADGTPVSELTGFPPDARSGWIAPDGQTIITGTTNTVQARSLADGSILSQLDGMTAIGFSPDGTVMATWVREEQLSSGGLRHVMLRRLPDGAPIATIEGSVPIAFSPDSATIVTSSGVWRVADGTLIERLEPATGQTTRPEGGCQTAAAVSPDGATIACGLSDGGLRLYRLADGTPFATLEGHRGPELRGRIRGAESIAFSPDGLLLLSGAQDASSQLWRLADGTKVGAITPGRERVRPVAFTPDGRTAVEGTQSGDLLLWAIGDGSAPAPKPIILSEHHSDLTWIGVTPDGATIVTASNDGTFAFWGIQ